MTVNLFGRKETWIPQALWDSFRPAPVSRWKPIAACAVIVMLPVLAHVAAGTGVVRPNLHLVGLQATYDAADHTLHVTWHIENHGRIGITIRGVASNGFSGAAASVKAPAGGTALVSQDYAIGPNDCTADRDTSGAVAVRYTSWHGTHAITTYGSGDLCEFVDPAPG